MCIGGHVPGKEIGPITRDTNHYRNLSLSADGKTIATVLARRYRTIDAIRRLHSPRIGPNRRSRLKTRYKDFVANNGVQTAIHSGDGLVLVLA
jgi:hypothetical protein